LTHNFLLQIALFEIREEGEVVMLSAENLTINKLAIEYWILDIQKEKRRMSNIQ